VTNPSGVTTITSPTGQSAIDNSSGDGDGPKVLCGFYHRRGWLSDEVYIADVAYAATVRPSVVFWYHGWAIPPVKVLERNQALEAVVWPFVWAWANSMAFVMELRKGKA